MTDHFSLVSFRDLVSLALNQHNKERHIFGISEDLFFVPLYDEVFRFYRYGQMLESPLGVAAGPHSQLAQNIVAAWLVGARYIELKTIQTLDELEISKPCIDMQDEGYNCEWSQELKIDETIDQYLNAWILIHILHDKFGWNDTDQLGMIFNMSAGYDYAGMQQENVQRFFAKMQDSSIELQQKIEDIKDLYPPVVDLKISPMMSNNITLSTMHGCPSDEIEQIGNYLITEKKLHTTIKLNPTLLGKETLQGIIKQSGFDTYVPDEAFEHDIKYEQATAIIRNLQQKADEVGVEFGIKLTNTLESENHKTVFDPKEKMMYASGRILHPISINIAHKLQQEFDGKLDASFSAGIHADNVTDTLACDLYPITVCSDLLKPGGYGRMQQYVENLREATRKSYSINDFINQNNNNKHEDVSLNGLDNLANYAAQTLADKQYQKTQIHSPSIKTSRELGLFDCAYAPCEDSCPTNQNIPMYMFHTANGDFDKALEVIRDTNPFPVTTGLICDHVCQTKCTRINYDSPVLIREIKRFVSENAKAELKPVTEKNKLQVAVIGAGPAGLSCAYYLTKAGFSVVIYEQKEKHGGMVSGAIPSFRLTDADVDLDVNLIIEQGVTIRYNQKVNTAFFNELQETNDAVFVAAGAQLASKLHIEGINSEDVRNPLQFLFDVKNNKKIQLGDQVIIIGGGNTAMDAARTAYRLVGKQGKVSIVYRRTIQQMPADLGEIKAVMAEGVEIMELVSPVKISAENGQLNWLQCVRMQLGEKGADGRARPIEIPDSGFTIPFDTLIPAVGQDLDINFVDQASLQTDGNYQTKLDKIFIGGDAMRGASTAINAIGDGRKAAQAIIAKHGENFITKQNQSRYSQSVHHLMMRKTKRVAAQKITETSLDERRNFEPVSQALTENQAMLEASRCLLCDEVCNICTTLCPNLALFAYEVEPARYELQKLVFEDDLLQTPHDSIFEITQSQQIIHIADWCNECGNCETFCPSLGAPYREKPHLYLNRKAFDADIFCYYLDSKSMLHYKDDQQNYQLTEHSDELVFSQNNSDITIDKTTFRIRDYSINESEFDEIKLQLAAQMHVVMQGAKAVWVKK